MITIKDLNFGYRRGHKLFESLNLELKQGHIYGLLGKNGEGKSTLLKLISGVLCPDGGSVESIGYIASDRKPSFLNQIYYLPEEFTSYKITMKEYARLIGTFYSDFSIDDLERYMSEFELSMTTKLTALSLGQKKKAAIAFALACNTKLLLMDEPTNGLDIPSKSQFRRIISSLASEDRMIIISTHQVRDLESMIDNIVILDGSRIVANAELADISQRLSFRELSSDDEPLYFEQSVMGCYGIVESVDGESSRVDIEMLFNAVTSSPETMSRFLNS